MSKLESALTNARNGFDVFPLAVGKKAPPLIKGWREKATRDEETIQQWWLTTPNANIGIHCDGFIVIDVDTKKGGDESLQLLDITYGIPTTRIHDTPSGGRHIIFSHPEPVQNSVELLAPGLDIRSRNGYICAPGSSTGSDTDYSSEDDTVPIAAAPAWLVQKLGTFTIREPSENLNISDASPETVGRALEWLTTAERSVKGDGGDQAAYRVACTLRDMGLSYPQACEAMRSDAWDNGCGWGEKLEAKPIRSAYKYATGESGSKAAAPDDFPVIKTNDTDASQSIKKSPKAIQLRSLAEFAGQEHKGLGYVVKGLLQRGTYAEMFGAPGEGKTFVALDIAYHVAAGEPWMERKVRGGPVLYLAYEGTGGLVRRAQALRQHYGDADIPLYIVGAAYNLRDKAGRQELGALIAKMPEVPVLIFVDTFARALLGGDENSAQDVGSFNSSIAALIEATSACVCIIHHSGKDKSKGARGSSALLGALDTEIEVDRGAVVARKQRDVEILPPIGFQLIPMVVGVDVDGDELTSCIVKPDAIAVGPNLRISGNARRGFEVLCNLSPSNKPIDQQVWQDACVAEFLTRTGSPKQRFYDLKKSLHSKGYIEIGEQGVITRRCE